MSLLITKWNAYNLSLLALKLVHNYLQNGKQTTENATISYDVGYSLWEDISCEVPQGSILGPI